MFPTTLLGSAPGRLQIKLTKDKQEETVITYLFVRLHREAVRSGSLIPF